MWVRQLAHYQSSGTEKKDNKDQAVSRFEKLRKNKLEPVFPELEAGSYILDIMQDIGYSKSGGMGMIPLDWIDIKSFSDVTGIIFTKDEAILIKKLSEAYVGQMQTSKYQDTYAPYLDQREVSNGFDLLFNAL